MINKPRWVKKKRFSPVNDTIKTILLWMVAGIVLVSVFNMFGPKRDAEDKISYSTFVNEVRQVGYEKDKKECLNMLGQCCIRSERRVLFG